MSTLLDLANNIKVYIDRRTVDGNGSEILALRNDIDAILAKPDLSLENNADYKLLQKRVTSLENKLVTHTTNLAVQINTLKFIVKLTTTGLFLIALKLYLL